MYLPRTFLSSIAVRRITNNTTIASIRIPNGIGTDRQLSDAHVGIERVYFHSVQPIDVENVHVAMGVQRA